MMKKCLLFSMICCLFLSTQPVMGLYEQTKDSFRSKYRCLLYGEDCSSTERKILAAYAVMGLFLMKGLMEDREKSDTQSQTEENEKKAKKS